MPHVSKEVKYHIWYICRTNRVVGRTLRWVELHAAVTVIASRDEGEEDLAIIIPLAFSPLYPRNEKADDLRDLVANTQAGWGGGGTQGPLRVVRTVC